MKKIITLFIVGLTCSLTEVNAQFHSWTKLSEGNVNGGNVEPLFVKTDESTTNGAVVQVGRFAGTVDFDPTSGVDEVTALSNSVYINPDWFIQKLDAAGNLLWTKYIQMDDALDNLEIVDVDVDATGGIVLLGEFSGGFDVNPGASTTEVNSVGSDANMIVLKLNSSGVFYFVYQSENISAYQLLIHGSQINISGDFYNSPDFDFGTNSVVSSNPNGKFILTLNANGQYISHIEMPFNSSGNLGHFLDYDPIDNAFYLFGYFVNSTDFDFGPGTYNLSPTPGIKEYYVLKISRLTGEFEEVHLISTLSGFASTDISDVDIQVGKMFITGEFTDFIDFDPSSSAPTLSTTVGHEVSYLTCIDLSNFSVLWAKKFENTGTITTAPSDIEVSYNSNKIYLSSDFQMSGTDISGDGSNVLTSNKNVLSYFDLQGNYLGSKLYNVNNGPSSLASFDNQDELYAVGYYTFNFDLNPDAGTLIPASESGSFISKFEATSSIGLNEEIENNFSLYPNPAQEFIQISGLNSGEITFSVFSLAGELIKKGKITSDETIDVSQLNKGVYLVNMFDGNQNSQVKFTKL